MSQCPLLRATLSNTGPANTGLAATLTLNSPRATVSLQCCREMSYVSFCKARLLFLHSWRASEIVKGFINGQHITLLCSVLSYAVMRWQTDIVRHAISSRNDCQLTRRLSIVWGEGTQRILMTGKQCRLSNKKLSRCWDITTCEPFGAAKV